MSNKTKTFKIKIYKQFKQKNPTVIVSTVKYVVQIKATIALIAIINHLNKIKAKIRTIEQRIITKKNIDNVSFQIKYSNAINKVYSK